MLNLALHTTLEVLCALPCRASEWQPGNPIVIRIAVNLAPLSTPRPVRFKQRLPWSKQTPSAIGLRKHVAECSWWCGIDCGGHGNLRNLDTIICTIQSCVWSVSFWMGGGNKLVFPSFLFFPLPASSGPEFQGQQSRNQSHVNVTLLLGVQHCNPALIARYTAYIVLLLWKHSMISFPIPCLRTHARVLGQHCT